MKYEIRKIKEEEYSVLEEFLYEAIFIPEGMERPPKDIIQTPELQIYLKNFGSMESDYGLVAVVDQKIVGAIWARIMNDYGHIDDETPSLALAIHQPYRGQGIGTKLLQFMMQILWKKGYQYVSLSVQKSNPARLLYEKLGFQKVNTVIGETEEIVMKHKL